MLITSVQAAEPKSCQLVRFSNPGWTDITTTTTFAKFLLESLGYKTSEKFLSVPITFAAMEAGDIDIFLGLWSPSMDQLIAPYYQKHTIESIGANLTNANYGVAVPTYLYDSGLQHFSDIAKFAKQLNNKIYAVEPGNDGNQILLSLVKNNKFDLKNIQIVESSEQAMLAQVDASIKSKQAIAFLAWEPHPMNLQYDIKYLPGAEAYFGKSATVYSLARSGYKATCPNVVKLISNLKFTPEIENLIMDKILNHGIKPLTAVKDWLKANPAILKSWLDGVTNFNGEKPTLASIEQKLL